MRCIVSISSRRSGWICGQDAGLPRPGTLPPLLLLPPPSQPSTPLPHQEPHLIHGTDLQAQFVHHCDEKLGTSVCVRCHRPTPGAQGPRVGNPRKPQAWFLCRLRPRSAPTWPLSGLKNPPSPSSASVLGGLVTWVPAASLYPQAVRSSTCHLALKEAAAVHDPALARPPGAVGAWEPLAVLTPSHRGLSRMLPTPFVPSYGDPLPDGSEC